MAVVNMVANFDFVFTFKESEEEAQWRSWEDAFIYGFVSAGHGEKYREQLEKLVPGHRLIVYVPKHGYAGICKVIERSVPVKDFYIYLGDRSIPILEAKLKEPGIGNHSENLELCEYLVRVHWEERRLLHNALRFEGMTPTSSIVYTPGDKTEGGHVTRRNLSEFCGPRQNSPLGNK